MTPDDAARLRSASAHVVVDDLETAALSDDAAHHLFRVLRLRAGEPVTITDGAGGWRSCRVLADASGVEPDGATHREPAPTDPLTVACAIPKRDRPEWIVQKLTELGVERIVLLHSARSVVRWDGSRAERHLARLRRVAAEAVQQSRGVWLPVIEGPIEATDLLPDFVVAEPGGRAFRPSDRMVAVGPEGGWSDEELELAADRIDLGTTILRVETAALTVAARATERSA